LVSLNIFVFLTTGTSVLLLASEHITIRMQSCNLLHVIESSYRHYLGVSTWVSSLVQLDDNLLHLRMDCPTTTTLVIWGASLKILFHLNHLYSFYVSRAPSVLDLKH
jgi:hypothetical protein